MRDLLISVAVSAANEGSSPWAAGGAAILGAIVGGAATGIATYKIEKSKQQFSIISEDRTRSYERKQELRAAQAVARLLYMEFARFSSMIGPSLTTKAKWWDHESYLVRRELTGDDQKLLVQCLTVTDFAAVMRARVAMDAVSALRAVLENSPEPFEDRAIELLRRHQNDIEGGMGALIRFTNSGDA